MNKQQPMLMESPLTKRVFVVTSYVDNGGGTFTARRKFDVTEQFDALAAMRQEGDDADYELRMDELLCRLTNGTWSKSRSYSVDFMVSCVDEAYEDAALGGGECELVYGEDEHGDDGWWCQSCGGWFAASFRHTGRDNLIVPRYCQHCGKAVKR